MLQEEDLKALNNEQVKFISIGKLSDTKHRVLYTYKSNRGKMYHLHFYIHTYNPNETLINFNPNQMTKEIKIVGSTIAHALKELLASRNDYRLKLVSGAHKITFNSLILPDIEQYKEQIKQKRKAGMKKAEVTALKEQIITLYEEAKTKVLPYVEDPNYYKTSVLLARGREAGYLVELLKELGFATSRKWTNEHQIIFNFDGFASRHDALLDYFEEELRKFGFHVRTHTWYD